MVIEVSKEIDLVRIGIDRYSLKTGLKLKTVMDVSIRVLKEPRGFIRVIQLVLAIIAFATTAGFSTSISFDVTCDGKTEELQYHFAYPFQIIDNEVESPECSNGDNGNHGNGDNGDENGEFATKLPFDYSTAAEFFVATGVVSFLYCIIILVGYIFFHQTYANNNKVPVVDLGITGILSVFWLAGSSAWAQAVVDLKYYMNPEMLFGIFYFCHDNKCKEESDGDYATLNVSLVFGFANFVLWLGSMWFVYKETIFHTPTVPSTLETQNQTKVGGQV